MEALLIDISSIPSIVLNNKNSKAFFTSLGLVEKAKEMATNLANRSFSHSLTTIGEISLYYINSANAAYKLIDINLFAYIAIDWYLFDKFYRIMIDTGASQHSTAGYGQLIAYTKDIKYTTIDISKASAIHV